jgi:tetratricopeptide (TPR) repeat protein
MRAALLILILAPVCPAGWTRVTSQQFEIFSDAGERDTRLLVKLLAQISSTISADGPRTARMFLFENESEFRAYHDRAEGFFASGVERDYIVLHAGPVSNRVVFHEFVHLVLSRSSTSLPLWFEEGTAELYSTLEPERDRVRVGEPIPAHLARLQGAHWLTATELAAITRQSPEYAERDRSSLFYAESWALVHMLNLAPAWRDGMPGFILALSAGRPPADAFESAFGRPIDAALSDLPRYLLSMRSVTVGAPTVAQPETRSEPLSADGATRALIDLALETDRRQQAHRLMEAFAKTNPQSPELPAVRASLALAEGRQDEALSDFDAAIRWGTRDASVYLEYAMLQQDRHAPRPDIDALLEHAVALDPDFGAAQFLIGVRQTDDGNFTSAIEHLKLAVRARPRRSDYWHAVGYAQFKLGRTAEALISARRAVAVSETTTQGDMAQALISLVETPPAQPPVRRAAEVITPPSWTNSKGDARVEGTLERVDCEGASASLLVRGQDGTTVRLHVDHPRQVEMVHSTPEYQFACGAQRARVAVEYNSRDRQVTRIEFLH